MQYFPALIAWTPLLQSSSTIKVIDCYSNFDNLIFWTSNPCTFLADLKKLFLAKGLLFFHLPWCTRNYQAVKSMHAVQNALLLNTCITSSIGKDVIKLEIRINLFCFVLISNHYCTLIVWWSTSRFRFQCISLLNVSTCMLKYFYYHSDLKSYKIIVFIIIELISIMDRIYFAMHCTCISKLGNDYM